MDDYLLFDPEKFGRLEMPFSFFTKVKTGGKTNVYYSDYNLDSLSMLYDGEKLKRLKLFAEERVIIEEKHIVSNYHKVKLNITEEEYLRKYLSQYFYESFRKIAVVLPELNPYHKIRTSKNGFTNLACKFGEETPELSFKIVNKDRKLTIRTFVRIENELFDLKTLKQFNFLVLRENSYYFLKKSDWQLLEELQKTETLDHKEFTRNYYPKLKNYPLDTSGVFREEIREIVPDTLIQVSELGGNLLLFIPRWDYDGTIVEDNKDFFEIYDGEKKIIYRRNKETEKETLDFLQQAHPNFKGQQSFYLTFAEASKKNWFFNFYHEQLKDNFSVIGMDMLGYFRYSQHPIQTTFNVLKTIDNEIVARIETNFGKEKIDPKSLQKAINEDKKFVLLKDNTLGILTDEWLRQYALMLRYSTTNKDEITFAKWILIVSESLVQQQKSLGYILPENWMRKWEQWNQTDEILYPVPKTINAELRKYQQKGYEWINMMAEVNAGTLLADEMGLGKTLQTITSIAHWKEQHPTLKILIICPASLIYNWKNEFEKFAPSINLSVYHGTDRDFTQFLESGNDVLISSYAIIRNDNEKFINLVWDGIILDESHNIKNYQAKQTQAVLRLTGKRRVILNGTPIMNNVSDLFPQLNFLLPQLFYSQKKFRNDFEKPIQNTVSGHTEMLRRLTNPFILRRTKEIAAPDLPQKTESVMWCEMDQDQRTAYEALKKQIKKNILVEINDKGLNKAKLGVLQGITKLRQACSSPRLLKEFDEFKDASSIKVNQLIESLTSNLKDNKVIVFSQFLGSIDLLAEEFDRHGIKYLSFSGSTPAEKRISLVSEFQNENSDVQVFLLSLMAGNSGINLTRANYVFLVEPWWNKAVQQQAIDRVHRIGQDQHVFAYNMICKDTIEEKIIALQNKKQSISDEVISNDENFVKNLSKEDIEFLFE